MTDFTPHHMGKEQGRPPHARKGWQTRHIVGRFVTIFSFLCFVRRSCVFFCYRNFFCQVPNVTKWERGNDRDEGASFAWATKWILNGFRCGDWHTMVEIGIRNGLTFFTIDFPARIGFTGRWRQTGSNVLSQNPSCSVFGGAAVLYQRRHKDTPTVL